jgi:putative FmdB family regulatory protein
MPIYEFYCPICNTVFSFFSRRVNTRKRPSCPRCGRPRIEREVSAFTTTAGSKGSKGEGGDAGDMPIDEAKVERAMGELAAEADDGGGDEDPRRAAEMMRKLAGMTGMKLGKGMEEAMGRMEAGEDPEKIEQDIGGEIGGEDEGPFLLPGGGKGRGTPGPGPRARPPRRDGKLYDM